MTKYFLDNDDDGHWYLIPVSRSEDWQRWVDNDYNWEDDFCSEASNWMIGGHPNKIEFYLADDNEDEQPVPA